MRIAFVTETWLPSTDGGVTRLAATVRELRAAGHDVRVVAPGAADGVAGTGPLGEPTDFAGAAVRRVPTVGLRRVYGGKRWGLPLPGSAGTCGTSDPTWCTWSTPCCWASPRSRRPAGSACRWSPLTCTDVAKYAAYYRLGWLCPVT